MYVYFFRTDSFPAHPSFPAHQICTALTNTRRKLDGSCQCGGVEFTLQSQTPVPYQLCACSICRKVGGYSGSVNLGGIADSLKILKGKQLIKYEPIIYPHSLQKQMLEPEEGTNASVENTPESKTAARPTRSAAPLSGTSVRTAVRCCGCGITTGQN